MNKKLKRTLKELKVELEGYKELTRKAELRISELTSVHAWPSVRKCELNSNLINEIYRQGIYTGIFYSLRKTITLIDEGYE